MIIEDGLEATRRRKGTSKNAIAESWQVLMEHQWSLRDQLKVVLAPRISFASLGGGGGGGGEWGESGSNFMSEKMLWSWSQET